MRPIITILLISIFSGAYGQIQNIDPCSIFKEAMSNNNIDTLDHYLAMDDTKLELNDRINLMTFKGAVLIKKHRDKGREIKNVPTSIIDSSYQLFSDAIGLVEDEKLKVGYRFRRYQTLSELKPSYQGMLSDDKYFKDLGYKKDKFGISANLVARYDGEFWLGADVTVFGGLQSPYNLKDGYGNSFQKSRVGISASFFIISHLRNVEKRLSETKFSIFRIEAPLYFDITQVGFVKTTDKSHWFYRPQVGVGYGRFSLSYGYSVYFKRASRDLLNKHSVNLNTKFVF